MIFIQVAVVVGLMLVLFLFGCVAVEAANRRPALGAFSLFLWLAMFVLFIEKPDIFVRNIGGINIVVPDVLCVFLMTVASIRLVRRPPRISRAFLLPLILIVGLLGISYLRGVLAFGLQPATNEFREFFYFLSALSFAASFPADRLAEKLPRVAMIGGVLLIVVALVRIPLMGGFGLEQRSVPSYAALATGQAFFFGWAWVGAREKSTAWRCGVFAFLLLSFLMLHRSVWLAMAGGIATLLIFDRTNRRILITAIVGMGVVAAIGIGLFAGDKVVAGLNQAVEEATAAEDSTFMWRIDGWLALLRPDSGWSFGNLLIGNPMGSGYARAIGNSVLHTHDIESGIIPHNYYISLILRGGIVGVAALLALYWKLVKAFLRKRGVTPVHAYSSCFLAILASQLVYYVPYSADMIQGIFLGAGVALASALGLQKISTGVPT